MAVNHAVGGSSPPSSVFKMKVEKLAKLIRIDLTDQEVKEFTPQLEEILSYFNKIDKLNVKNVKPSFLPIETQMELREDKVEPSLPPKEALKNAIHKEKNFFKGPKTI